jgi:thiamine biosynthesis lipoprotein
MATDPVSHRFAPRRIALLLAGILILAWLTWWRSPFYGAGPSKLVMLTGPTMGTTFTIKIVERGREALPQAELQAIVQRELDLVSGLMSTYDPESEISRFNASPSTDAYPIAVETAEVVACAIKISDQTIGAFDITLGPIIDAYGFGPPGRVELPSDETIEGLREHVGYKKLVFDENTPAIRKLDPQLHVDLNAIAPGYAVDRIANALNDAGVENYLIELGGEIRARGRNADGETWRAGIEKPIDGERIVHRVVPLEGLSLATSGDYRDYYEHEGTRISHTIDGRTGRPVAHNLASVSVIHESCMWADAYATAIMALGPGDGYILAEILNLPALFILREAGGLTERATPAFEAQFGTI